MARGELPKDPLVVPTNIFVPYDILYRFVYEMDRDLMLLEGQQLAANQQVTNSTVLVEATELRIPVLAGKKYRIRGKLLFSTNAKLQLDFPAGTIRGESRALSGAGEVVAFLNNPANIVANNANSFMFSWDMMYHNPAADGNFTVSWAQLAANVVASDFYAGSFVQCSIVA